MRATGWTALVLAAAGLATAAPVAEAKPRVAVSLIFGDGHGRRDDAFRHGYERGLREGSDEGFKDGRRGHDFAYWREGDYRNSDQGYRGWMGPKPAYCAGFRRGYEEGYRRAFASARPRWSVYGRRDGRWDDRDRDRYDDRYDRRDRDDWDRDHDRR